MEDPAYLHFDPVLINQLSQWLRDIGKKLLERALDRKLPQYDDLFAPSGSGLYARSLQRPSSNLLPSFARLVERQVNDIAAAPEIWRGSFLAELERQVDNDIFFRIPGSLWSLIECRAWCDPNFERWVADLLQPRLATRYLGVLLVEGRFRLHPTFFWMLIAMACYTLTAPASGGRFRLLQIMRQRLQRWSAQHERQQVLVQLRRVASANWQRSRGWASWCDQWTLLEVERVWNTGAYPQDLQKALFDLPLYHLKSITKPVSVLAYANWQEHVPPGLLDWYPQR